MKQRSGKEIVTLYFFQGACVKRVAILVGEFHKEKMKIMVEAAKKTAAQCGLEVINEVWVSGSMEKPLQAKKILAKKEISGLIVLGIIERGETKHGFVMAQAVITALINIQLEVLKPMGVGILGPEILPEQISSRLVPYAENAVRALAKSLSQNN